jgi:hypothetical protein
MTKTMDSASHIMCVFTSCCVALNVLYSTVQYVEAE